MRPRNITPSTMILATLTQFHSVLPPEWTGLSTKPWMLQSHNTNQIITSQIIFSKIQLHFKGQRNNHWHETLNITTYSMILAMLIQFHDSAARINRSVNKTTISPASQSNLLWSAVKYLSSVSWRNLLTEQQNNNPVSCAALPWKRDHENVWKHYNAWIHDQISIICLFHLFLCIYTLDINIFI